MDELKRRTRRYVGSETLFSGPQVRHKSVSELVGQKTGRFLLIPDRLLPRQATESSAEPILPPLIVKREFIRKVPPRVQSHRGSDRPPVLQPVLKRKTNGWELRKSRLERNVRDVERASEAKPTALDT